MSTWWWPNWFFGEAPQVRRFGFWPDFQVCESKWNKINCISRTYHKPPLLYTRFPNVTGHPQKCSGFRSIQVHTQVPWHDIACRTGVIFSFCRRAQSTRCARVTRDGISFQPVAGDSRSALVSRSPQLASKRKKNKKTEIAPVLQASHDNKNLPAPRPAFSLNLVRERQNVFPFVFTLVMISGDQMKSFVPGPS